MARSKQEQIKDSIILNITKACPKMSCGDIVKLADSILEGEGSQGVVVKVERELPELMFVEGYGYLQSHSAQCILDKAGCVAVEPLIREA